MGPPEAVPCPPVGQRLVPGKDRRRVKWGTGRGRGADKPGSEGTQAPDAGSLNGERECAVCACGVCVRGVCAGCVVCVCGVCGVCVWCVLCVCSCVLCVCGVCAVCVHRVCVMCVCGVRGVCMR